MNMRSLVVVPCLVLLLPGVAVRAVAQTPVVEVRARITGYLLKTYCRPGAAVKKGDLLFEIDAAPYLARFDQASAKVDLAEAHLQKHLKSFARAKKLRDAKVIAQDDLDDSAAQVTVAQAERAIAQAGCAVAALPVSAAKVHAPIDGTIARLPVIAGNLIKADDTVLAILEPPGPQKKPAAETDKIKELLKERRDLLQKVADRLMVRYKSRQIPGRDVMMAQKAAFDAALELAETPAERIDGLRKILKVAEQMQAAADDASMRGAGTETEALQARAVVLEVRIMLLREEAKTKKLPR